MYLVKQNEGIVYYTILKLDSTIFITNAIHYYFHN